MGHPTIPSGASPYSGCNPSIQYYDYIQHIDRWSNELRLQSKPGGRFHWSIGAYWEKTRDIYSDYFHMPGLQSKGQAWQYYCVLLRHCGAADAGRLVQLYRALGLSAGHRVHQRGLRHHAQAAPRSGHGALPVSFLEQPTTAASGTFRKRRRIDGGSSEKWNSKVGLSYKPLDSLLVYADWAQGFRDGGVNGGLPAGCVKNGVPAQFVPDTLTNWELGWKSTLARRASCSGTVPLYYMPWKNLQTLVFDPTICPSSSFNANVGDARVYGAETDLKYQASAFLTMGFSASYNDSALTSN